MSKHFNVIFGKQEEVIIMNRTVNIENKFLLTFTEASRYFGIGENKLRNMASLEQNPDWLLYNGSRQLIKRVRLEEILLKSETI